MRILFVITELNEGGAEHALGKISSGLFASGHDVRIVCLHGADGDVGKRLRADGPLSIKELAAPLPISRQAVTKHLDILRASGLIRMERVGRERLQFLVADPLREVADWLEPYAEAWDRRLRRLKQHLEDKR